VPQLTRSQLLVYGALAVVLLLVGARWIRGADERGSPPGNVAFAADAEAGGEAGGEGGGVFELEAGGGDVVVHVAGAVRDTGVYHLPSGSRVADAVERAGGVSADALPDGINLAARLADGQQVQVPGKVKGAALATGGGETDGPISLGSATLEQLDSIEGIGPVTAQNIIDFRDERGGLGSIDELDELSGIGPATMESLRARLQP
jgi:competence protein ComEA